METQSISHFEYIASEYEKHLEDAETSKLGHFNAAGTFEKRYKILAITTALTGVILVWLLTSPFDDFLNPQLTKFLSEGLPIFFGLLSTAFTTLNYFFDFSNLAEKHRIAAHKYQSIWRQCQNWNTDFPTEEFVLDAQDRVSKIRDRLTEINSESPQIPRWAWKSVDKQKSEGSTTYDGANSEDQ